MILLIDVRLEWTNVTRNILKVILDFGTELKDSYSSRTTPEKRSNTARFATTEQTRDATKGARRIAPDAG